MRYVVLGAGAVGGVIGARLHLAGVPVQLVARGEHLATIQRDGLVLDTHEGRRVVDTAAVGSAGEVAWTHDTVVLLAVKSHQTAAALADLVVHAPPSTPVVCVQNGVANEAVVRQRFAATYGVTVMLPSTHLEPGVVVQKCHPVPGILDIGCFPTGTDAVCDAYAADLRRAGFVAEPRADIMAWKHRKLLVNVAGDVRSLYGQGEASDELVARSVAEGESVLRVAGTPVVTAEEDTARRGDLLQVRPGLGGGNSLVQSLTRSLPTEIDHRAGEIVRLGRLHDVATPTNDLVVRDCHALSSEGLPPRLDAAGALASLRR